MQEKSAATFYVDISIEGIGSQDFLVDTGAGYMTVSQEAIDTLLLQGDAIYLRDLEGVLADGSRLIVPVYRLTRINIGGTCELRDVEAAVLPGTQRGLLGLSALRKTAPFIFAVEPPMLHLSNCSTTVSLSLVP